MEQSNGSVGDTSGQDTFADRDLGGTDGGGNRPVAERDTAASGERDPFAYRDTRRNSELRFLFVERWIIDHGFGGSVERFDAEAGVKRDDA